MKKDQTRQLNEPFFHEPIQFYSDLAYELTDWTEQKAISYIRSTFFMK